MSATFLDEVTAYDMPIQLVLDGAIVENIEDHLASHGLAGRPLFRETTDRETLLAGPWLVERASDRAALERCVAAARSAGKGVFWLGEPDAGGLYRHLRRLNAAKMPDGRILYFRHYDSDVLAAMVPLLDAQQAAHLFGPARVIGLIGGTGDGRTIEKPDDLPEQGSGPITFEPRQIEILDERQRGISRGKIVEMLYEKLPGQTSGKSFSVLEELVLKNEKEAKNSGFISEKSFGAWAYLDLLTGGAFSRDKELQKLVKTSRAGTPDQNLEVGLPYIIRGIRTVKKRAT